MQRSEPQIDFLIIGAAKCATTWLQWTLSQSPDLWMPSPELHYFSRHYDRGAEWYRAQFAGSGAARVIGEKSNSYLTTPEAAERIHRDLPGVRLIVQMRDPVERAYSDYCMLFRRGEVSGDIHRHLEPSRAEGQRFLDHGRYAHHLARFQGLFGPDRILPLIYEEVVADPEAHLALVSRHLGLAIPPPVSDAGRVKDRTVPIVPRWLRHLLLPVRPLLDPVRDAAPVRAIRRAVARPVAYPPLPEDLAERIAAYYSDDIKHLERMTGCDLTKWRAFSMSDGDGLSERVLAAPGGGGPLAPIDKLIRRFSRPG